MGEMKAAADNLFYSVLFTIVPLAIGGVILVTMLQALLGGPKRRRYSRRR
jgi:hypothetical protein